jgi:hypothetical protein
MCEVSELHYNFDRKIGTLRMAENQSCSTGGLIALFTAIDPNVRGIEVFSGSKLDGLHKLGPDGWDVVLTR